jgi:hypothetical protein
VWRGLTPRDDPDNRPLPPPVGGYCGAMTHRALRAFQGLPVAVRLLWYVAMFEALSIFVRLVE